MRLLLTAIAFFVLTLLGGVAGSQAEEITDTQIAEAMRLVTLVGMQAKANERGNARESFVAALAEPGFQALPGNIQFGAYATLSILELEDAPEAAYARYAAAMREYRDLATSYHFSLEAYMAVQTRNGAVALAALDMLVNTFREPEFYWGEGTLTQVLNATRGDASLAEKRHELMVAVWESGNRPTKPFARENWFWFELLTSHAERGETEAARAVLARLNDPNFVARLQFDKRFTRFGAALSAGGYALAQQKELAWARQAVADNPNHLEGVHILSRTLTDMGEFEEALSIIGEALKRADDPSAEPFEDLEDMLQWTHDQRARILFRMGKHDEALDAETKALELSSRDQISHHVNLGAIYNWLGRPMDALTIIEKAGSGSHYGNMAVAGVRACAHAQLGNDEELDATREFLASHRDDGFAVLVKGMLCADRPNELAEILIEQIRRPETRSDALARLQNFELRGNLTDYEQVLADRLAALIARPDVQAVIDEHGKILSWPSVGTEI